MNSKYSMEETNKKITKKFSTIPKTFTYFTRGVKLVDENSFYDRVIVYRK